MRQKGGETRRDQKTQALLVVLLRGGGKVLKGTRLIGARLEV